LLSFFIASGKFPPIFCHTSSIGVASFFDAKNCMRYPANHVNTSSGVPWR
jgi:hypothetical protein